MSEEKLEIGDHVTGYYTLGEKQYSIRGVFNGYSNFGNVTIATFPGERNRSVHGCPCGAIFDRSCVEKSNSNILDELKAR